MDDDRKNRSGSKREISDRTDDEIRMKRRQEAKRRREAQVRRSKRILAGCVAGAVLAVIAIAAAVHTAGTSKTAASDQKSAAGNTMEAAATAGFETASAGSGAAAGSGTASGSEAAASDSAAPAGSEAVVANSGAVASDSSAKITPTDLKMSFVGDVTLGKDENFAYDTSMNAYYDQNGPDYFLKNVKDIFSDDDLTVINLEGTLTSETVRADKTYAFKAPPEYVDIISNASIEAANVANNHSHDYGDKSYTDTLSTLKENNITSFGYDDTALLDIKGVKVGLFGIYELEKLDGVASQITSDISKLKDAGADVIVAVFHWGIERNSCPDQYQVELAHQAIDEGADLVIGHHPHVLQGIEYYKDKAVAYSLGNFCFGGNSNPQDKDTMIFQTTFSFDENADITGSSINIIPCRVSATPDYNDYVPTPLTGNDAQSVIDKLDERSQEIAATYQTDTVYHSS